MTFQCPIPTASQHSNEAPKPRRTGAWLRQELDTHEARWSYTANPELYIGDFDVFDAQTFIASARPLR